MNAREWLADERWDDDPREAWSKACSALIDLLDACDDRGDFRLDPGSRNEIRLIIAQSLGVAL